MSEAYKKHAKDYIKKAINAGYGKGEIIKKLQEAGYPPDIIREAFSDIEGRGSGADVPYDMKKIVFFGLAILILILVVVLVITASTSMSKEKFIEKANLCQKAEFTKEMNGTTYRFTANNCVFTKKIIKMAADEPQEVKDLFMNQKLECSYSRGQFNPNWINYLTKDLGDCEGELKDIIVEIITYKK